MTKIQGDRDSVFTYTGHFWHGQSGLNLTVYRAYDPVLGRWLSRDPIAELGGINCYLYVNDDPLNFVDPYGLDKATCLAGCAKSRDTQTIAATSAATVAILGIWAAAAIQCILAAGLTAGAGSVACAPIYIVAAVRVAATLAALAAAIAFFTIQYDACTKNCSDDPPKSCPTGPIPYNPDSYRDPFRR